MDLDVYGLNHIESFLSNYEIWVKDLAKVAAEWPNLDEEERSHYRAEFMQVWGNRKVRVCGFAALSPTPPTRIPADPHTLFALESADSSKIWPSMPSSE